MIKSTEMSNSPSKRVKDDLNRLAVKLELFGIKFYQTDACPCFHIVIDKDQEVSTKVIVIPAEKHIIYKKIPDLPKSMWTHGLSTKNTSAISSDSPVLI